MAGGGTGGTTQGLAGGQAREKKLKKVDSFKFCISFTIEQKSAMSGQLIMISALLSKTASFVFLSGVIKNYGYAQVPLDVVKAKKKKI